MRVSVIGTGYVGLTTGVSLAYLGHRVTCVDVDPGKVELLQSGGLPIYEPGLKQLLELAGGKIDFTTAYDSIREADVAILAVGTPAQEDGSPNLTYLLAAAEDVIRQLHTKQTMTVLVNKSTVPVGTGDKIGHWIGEAGLKDRVLVASNPEFLRQGRAVSDTLYPDRIVAGGNERAVQVLAELYAPLVAQSFAPPEGIAPPDGYRRPTFIAVDRRSAELAKYAANAFLAMKISFINEIANVCDRVGANVNEIAGIIGADPRIGASFLQAGIGYGGSCFPKDTKALHHIADTNGYDFKLLSAVIEVNQTQKFVLLEKLREQLNELHGCKVAVLGLAFKPGTDDMREAPSLPIIASLLEAGAQVAAHDPVAADKARAMLPAEVQLASEVMDALQDADAALLVTEWPEYMELDFDEVRKAMRRPLWLDGRNALDRKRMEQIEYHGIGVGGQRLCGSWPSVIHA